MSHRFFLAALTLGLLLRLATLPLPGHDDVMTWKIWSYAATTDVTGMYSVGMHESHQLLEIPLLVLAASLQPDLRAIAVTVSAIVALTIANLATLVWLAVRLASPTPRTVNA